MAAKGPWPCLSGVDCPGSTTGDAALSSALVERAVETLVAALIAAFFIVAGIGRSEEHKSELQSLMRISYAVFCLKKNDHLAVCGMTAAAIISLRREPTR